MLRAHEPRGGATVALVAALVAGAHSTVAHAQPVGAELSPGVAWESYGPDTRAVGVRRLNAAEVRLAQQRAEAIRAALIASPSFATPRDRAHLVISHAAIESPRGSARTAPPVLQQSLLAYWSAPTDVRRTASGVLVPKLGGSHELLTFELNEVPHADMLVDRATAGDFRRGDDTKGERVFFAQPRAFGQVGGGTVFVNTIVFTRDGQSVLEPAPIGELLDLEIARLDAVIGVTERLGADRLREAEASMTPARVAERRAKREAAWQRETRNPSDMAQRLDAAHRTDLADVERTRADVAIPATSDPRHRYWGPKLARDAAQQLSAALGVPGRRLPACARLEPGFQSSYAVRFTVIGSAPDCVPMVQVRTDLMDPAQPVDAVQLITVHFRDSQCGAVLGGVQGLPRSERCVYAVPLLREMNWAVVRRAVGWP